MDQRLVVSGTLEDCFAFYNRLDFAVRDEYYIVSVVPAFQIMIPN